ncbi:MAG: hypothetical protein ACPGO5_01515 [Patescibacteria group bacterium]
MKKRRLTDHSLDSDVTLYLVVYKLRKIKHKPRECWITVKEGCFGVLKDSKTEVVRCTFTGKSKTARAMAVQKAKKEARKTKTLRRDGEINWNVLD